MSRSCPESASASARSSALVPWSPPTCRLAPSSLVLPHASSSTYPTYPYTHDRTQFMNIPLVDLHAQYLTIKDEVDAAIQRTLAQSAFIGGDELRAFETEFAGYCEA